MALLHKILRGTGRRYPRYRDELGRSVAFGRLISNGPRAVLTGLGRKLLGKRPQRPWISYDAAAAFALHLDPARSNVLEYGSGMSTAWLAARSARVTSIEADPGWFAELSHRLAGREGVTLRLGLSQADYVSVPAGELFDLILIDGSWRCECAKLARSHLAPGGVIYLDNSDKQGGTSGNLAEARRVLIEFAEENSLPWAEITDFAPTQFFVERGLWVGPNPPV